ncbi:MAG: YgjV family protein [Bacteroidia bacterium]|nr:YgjV family protein [Bacteroidia bacterium]
MEITFTEIIGYIASFVVLISFLMKQMNHLRIINLIGCFLFVIYGVLLHYSIPVILTNTVIIIINVYYLVKARKKP